MEQLKKTGAEEVRLSTDEVQAILQRLRGSEETSGTTVADLAEATGVPPTRISELLTLVRQEGAARLSGTVRLRRRGRLRTLAFGMVALAGTTAMLTAPLLSGPLMTLESASSHRVVDSYGKGMPGRKVVARFTMNPRSLWGRLFASGTLQRLTMPSLYTPDGEIESVRIGDGTDHPIHPAVDLLARSPGRYETTYEYPEVPVTQRATRLHDQIYVEGQMVDLDVPLR